MGENVSFTPIVRKSTIGAISYNKELSEGKMIEELLTISQVASYLNVCDKTVRRLIEKKEIVAYKVGGSWRIEKRELEKYLKNNRNF